MALNPGTDPAPLPEKLKAYRGTDFDALITDIPYEITGFSYIAELYSRDGGPAVKTLSATLENDPAGIDSKVLFSLTSDEVDALEDENYKIYIKQIDATGHKTPFIVGEVDIIAEEDV